MSLSSAAASLQRSRAPTGPRVLIACGGAARLLTLPALRALAGDRREIKNPAADLNFSNRPISAANAVPSERGMRKEPTMLRDPLEEREETVDEDPTQGRQHGQLPDEDPTQGRQHGQLPDEDPTQGRQHRHRPDEDPTLGG